MEGLASAAAMAAPLSERAREIAKSRDELLGLLRGLPKSKYELSLIELVEKGSVVGNSAVGCKSSPPKGESKRASTAAVKERKKKRRSSRGSCGSSSSDGVLLNFYVPASLSWSLIGAIYKGTSRLLGAMIGSQMIRCSSFQSQLFL